MSSSADNPTEFASQLKMSSGSVSRSTSIIRSETVWFHDGNLVIEADGTGFRVYRGLITKHSPVFRDMLSLPQPPDQELFDGVPVVRLHDSAQDLTSFLSALYDSSFYEKSATTEFAVIAAIFKLSVKYDVDYLRRRVLEHLLDNYPDELGNFDERSETLTETPFLAFEVLNLARSANISATFLPAVCYDIATHENFLEGILWASTHCTSLTPKELCSLHKSREALFEATESLYEFRREHKCRCQITLCQFDKNSEETWKPLAVDVSWGVGEAACVNRAMQTFKNSREKLWDDLPSFFGFPPWDEMESTDSEPEEEEGE